MESTVPNSAESFADNANEWVMSFDHLWTADTSRSDWRTAVSAAAHRKGA
jgi:hypothetical protein